MDVQDLLSRTPRTHFIDGAFTGDEPTLEVVNPATAQVLTTVADGSPDHGTRALDAACAAQAEWAATQPRERSELLMGAYDRVHERADDFAWLMTLEMGKPLSEAHGEVTYGAEFLRWFAEEAVRVTGQYGHAPSGGRRILTMRQPVGPVLAITPWNFPLAMATRKIGPALAAGCTVVLKPASATPLTALLLMDVLREVGLPAGVVNCVVTSSSSDVTGPLLQDPRLRKLTFTGSTEVGRALMEQSAQRVLRISMELGGNAPFLVLPSADLDRAVEGAVQGKLRNVGEACTAANRFLVHESLAAEFSRRLAERFSSLTVGDGTTDGVDIGPVINQDALDNLLALVHEATGDGATVLSGGERADGAGWFLQPTVLTSVSPQSRVMREEIFGPIAPITTFRSTDEALSLANDSDHGLLGYVFAEDLSEALSTAERLETGIVAVNSGVVSDPAAPFGGVKTSGLGREGGREGIEEYLELKYVGVSL